MLGGVVRPGNAPGYARPVVAPAWVAGPQPGSAVRPGGGYVVAPRPGSQPGFAVRPGGGYGAAPRPGIRALHQQALMPYKGGCGPAGARPRPQLAAPPALAGPAAGFRPAVPAGHRPPQQRPAVARQGVQASQAAQADLHVANIVKEFARAAVDFGTNEQQLELVFQRVQAARHAREAFRHRAFKAPGGVPALPALPALPAPAGPAPHLAEPEAQQRREQLLQAVSSRLEATGGAEPLNSVTSDPAITSLRKGAVSNVAKFLSEFPEYFEIALGPNPKEGKGQIQIIRLLQPVPQGLGLSSGKWKREELPEAERREALLQSIVDALTDAGGVTTVNDLGVDWRVRAAAVGVNVKLQKFIAEYPEVFSLALGDGGPARVVLLVDPATAVATADVRAKMEAPVDVETVTQSLVEELEAALVSGLGEVPLNTLSENPTIAGHRNCLGISLKKFLAQFPERFELLGENNAVRVRLAAGL